MVDGQMAVVGEPGAEERAGILRLEGAGVARADEVRRRWRPSPGYTRSRVLDEIRLAKVRLAQHEPAEAATVAAHAIHLAADTRSSVVVNWLTTFSHDLGARGSGAPAASDFRDQLRDYVRKTAPTRLPDLP